MVAGARWPTRAEGLKGATDSAGYAETLSRPMDQSQLRLLGDGFDLIIGHGVD